MNEEILTRRSPVYRKTNLGSASLQELNGYIIPMTMTSTSTDDEIAASEKLLICDVSWLPRIGFKGRDTIKWLSGSGQKLPENANSIEKSSDGSLVVRLGLTEFLILTDPNYMGELAIDLAQQFDANNFELVNLNTYSLPRQDSHACFLLCGEYAPQLLAKICAIDLRDSHFQNLDIVQSSIARLSSIVIRNDLSETLSFLILTDSSSAEYLWNCILDAGEEYNCRVVGYKSILNLKDKKESIK